MLVCYIGECMVSTINLNNGIKEPTHGYQNLNTSQIMIFGGYVKVREAVCTHSPVILGQFYLGMKVLAWYIDPTGIKNSEILIIDIRMVSKNLYQTKTGLFLSFSCLRMSISFP